MTATSIGSSRSNLSAIEGRTYLYTAAEGPPLDSQREAYLDYLNNRGRAELGRLEHATVEVRVRGRIARLVGMDPSSVAVLGNASEALNVIASALDVEAGDNVVSTDLEYPSVVQPWILRQGRGVELRLARSRGGRVTAGELAELVDERTRVIALSHVSYLNSWRADLAAAADLAHAVGAVLVVDATQSLGVLPFPPGVADAVVCSSYKYLLGGHGVGFLCWDPARLGLGAIPGAGWRSVPDLFASDRFERVHPHADARRFEVGFPAYSTLYALDASLEWLAGFDASAVERHVLELAGELARELRGAGWPVLTPELDAERGSSVSFAARDAHSLAGELAEQHAIDCWGGDGRIRASFHLFNQASDVDALLRALKAYGGRHMP